MNKNEDILSKATPNFIYKFFTEPNSPEALRWINSEVNLICFSQMNAGGSQVFLKVIDGSIPPQYYAIVHLGAEDNGNMDPPLSYVKKVIKIQKFSITNYYGKLFILAKKVTIYLNIENFDIEDLFKKHHLQSISYLLLNSQNDYGGSNDQRYPTSNRTREDNSYACEGYNNNNNDNNGNYPKYSNNPPSNYNQRNNPNGNNPRGNTSPYKYDDMYRGSNNKECNNNWQSSNNYNKPGGENYEMNYRNPNMSITKDTPTKNTMPGGYNESYNNKENMNFREDPSRRDPNGRNGYNNPHNNNENNNYYNRGDDNENNMGLNNRSRAPYNEYPNYNNNITSKNDGRLPMQEKNINACKMNSEYSNNRNYTTNYDHNRTFENDQYNNNNKSKTHNININPNTHQPGKYDTHAYKMGDSGYYSGDNNRNSNNNSYQKNIDQGYLKSKSSGSLPLESELNERSRSHEYKYESNNGRYSDRREGTAMDNYGRNKPGMMPEETRQRDFQGNDNYYNERDNNDGFIKNGNNRLNGSTKENAMYRERSVDNYNPHNDNNMNMGGSIYGTEKENIHIPKRGNCDSDEMIEQRKRATVAREINNNGNTRNPDLEIDRTRCNPYEKADNSNFNQRGDKKGSYMKNVEDCANSINGSMIYMNETNETLSNFDDVNEKKKVNETKLLKENNLNRNNRKCNPYPNSAVIKINDGILMPINKLSQYSTKWIIKARVQSKDNIRKFYTGNKEGKVFNIELCDESGEIKVNFFGKAVDKWYDYLEVGKIYKISKGNIKSANKKFNTLKHDCEITLDENSILELLEENDMNIPKYIYNFYPISEIKANINTGTLVDVIGIVLSFQELNQILIKKTGQYKEKKDLMLIDETNETINVTLWGESAVKMEEMNITENCIICFKCLKVGEWQGKKLESHPKTKVEIDPELDKAYTLKNWWTNNKKNVYNTINLATSTSNNNMLNLESQKTIQEIKKNVNLANEEVLSGKGIIFTTFGFIDHIYNSIPVYSACPNCNKKMVATVIEDGEQDMDENVSESMYCSKCNKNNIPVYNYSINLKITDNTDSLRVSAFANAAKTIMNGLSAEEFMKLRQEHISQENIENFDLIEKAKLNEFFFRIKAYMTSHMDEIKKNYTILETIPLSKLLVDNCRYLIKEIKLATEAIQE
ncbi:replication protein A1, large subunit, putative [Plasmodium chabaudi adami]|uniref:Replication protein A1, large subunit, putative n=1 Tax=Plasmodium chabaudi adami TaxID=5826 RepID=A0A1C6XPC8_PLACE|nr:replication protein A1, large subunit, putative [Plasmodium chabaudi adami]